MKPRHPYRLWLSLGSSKSLEAGASTVFIAQDDADKPIDAIWTLALTNNEGAIVDATTADFPVTGCLFPLGGDQSCQEEVQGSRIGYRAPESLPTGREVQMVQVNINTVGNGNFGFTTESVVIVGAGGVPITGHGGPAYAAGA